MRIRAFLSKLRQTYPLPRQVMVLLFLFQLQKDLGMDWWWHLVVTWRSPITIEQVLFEGSGKLQPFLLCFKLVLWELSENLDHLLFQASPCSLPLHKLRKVSWHQLLFLIQLVYLHHWLLVKWISFSGLFFHRDPLFLLSLILAKVFFPFVIY